MSAPKAEAGGHDFTHKGKGRQAVVTESRPGQSRGVTGRASEGSELHADREVMAEELPARAKLP